MHNIEKLVEQRDVPALKAYMAEHNLVIRDGWIVPRDDKVKLEYQRLAAFWNQRQQAR
jgi:hypothetical protein